MVNRSFKNGLILGRWITLVTLVSYKLYKCNKSVPFFKSKVECTWLLCCEKRKFNSRHLDKKNIWNKSFFKKRISKQETKIRFCFVKYHIHWRRFEAFSSTKMPATVTIICFTWLLGQWDTKYLWILDIYARKWLS